jgi:hypothetical protein
MTHDDVFARVTRLITPNVDRFSIRNNNNNNDDDDDDNDALELQTSMSNQQRHRSLLVQLIFVCGFVLLV